MSLTDWESRRSKTGAIHIYREALRKITAKVAHKAYADLDPIAAEMAKIATDAIEDVVFLPKEARKKK